MNLRLLRQLNKPHIRISTVPACSKCGFGSDDRPAYYFTFGRSFHFFTSFRAACAYAGQLLGN